MRVSDRILLILLALVFLASGIAIVISQFNLMFDVPFEHIVSLCLGNVKYSTVISFGLAGLMLLLGACLIVIVMNSRHYIKDKRNDAIRIPSGESGTASITVDAVRAIAKKKCMSFRFVYDCMASVTILEKGIDLHVKIKPYSDVILPNAVKELQDELITTIANQTGITTRSVSVLVLPYSEKKNN